MTGQGHRCRWVEGGPAVFSDRVVRSFACLGCGEQRTVTAGPFWAPSFGWTPGESIADPVPDWAREPERTEP